MILLKAAVKALTGKCVHFAGPPGNGILGLEGRAHCVRSSVLDQQATTAANIVANSTLSTPRLMESLHSRRRMARRALAASIDQMCVEE